jgi:hypothetical protein
MLEFLEYHMSSDTNKPDREWVAHNYCVAFIDLLGQRDAMRGQGLLKLMESDDELKAFHDVLRNSIGAIIKLQERAEDLLAPVLKKNLDSPRRAALSKDQHEIWDEMNLTRIKTQRWSDGLMTYVSLGDIDIKCRMNGVFNVFNLAATLCLLGLATGRPIRGAIEIAWGVELNHNELYGPAVARAYELESEIAQYPRIVIGSETVRLLEAHAANPAEDVFSKTDRELATLCLDMLIQDIDGYWILHYLGERFQFVVTHGQHIELYGAARKFVLSQLVTHQTQRNTKLAFRYAQLLQYFDSHEPTKPE